MNKTFRRYLITVLAGLIITGAVFLYEIQQLDIHKQLFTIISNSTFVSGALMLLAGLMCLVSNGGGFDAFAYLSYRVRKRFKKKKKGPDGYYEFVTNRKERNKILLDNFFVTGAVLAAVAGVTAVWA